MDNPEQQTPSSPTPEPTSSYYGGKRNWLKLGLIYLVVGALLYGGFYYFVLSKNKSNPYSSNYNYNQTPITTYQSSPTPTLDPTANWKTYTHKENYYSLKYPPNLLTKEVALGTNSACKTELQIADPSTGFSDKYLSDIVIDVCTVVKQFYPEAAFSNVTGTPQQTITLDGKKGYVKSGTADLMKIESKMQVKRYVFFENNLEYTIDFYQVPSGSQEMNKTFDQILSTFRFTP